MVALKPQPGLVISYSYLWHHEHRAGRDEGTKDRPCVIVLSVEHPEKDKTRVRVVAITHRQPDDPAVALELPAAVKRHLGLDADRSWVILDEVNEFAWPGFDLRPISRYSKDFAYGFLPPRMFDRLIVEMREVWRLGQSRTTPRD